jgi:hypothetical protein
MEAHQQQLVSWTVDNLPVGDFTHATQHYFYEPISDRLLETVTVERDRLAQLERHYQNTLRWERQSEFDLMASVRRRHAEMRECVRYVRASIEARERRLAMAMAFHPRLGQDSVMRRTNVPDEMAREIGRQCYDD